MEGNQSLISFLARQAKKLPPGQRDSFAVVIESIKLCPLILDLADSLDLIGVDDLVANSLRDFFTGTDKYVPKDGSIAHQMLRALHKFHPHPVAKSDVLKEIGYRPPPVSTFRPTANFFGAWASMKTLIAHDLVSRGAGSKGKFSLSDHGLAIACNLFGPVTQSEVSDNMNLLVNSSDIHCRLSVDVVDVMYRCQITWKEASLPVGSVWFGRGDQICDFVVQFGTVANASDENLCRTFAGAPFSRRILVVHAREAAKHAELKLKTSANHDITIVFAESPAEIATYLCQITKLLERTGSPRGVFSRVCGECNKGKSALTVADVWEEQLKLLPGSGPSFAANFAAVFPTPQILSGFLERSSDPRQALMREVAERWGRKPRDATVDAILGLFTEQ